MGMRFMSKYLKQLAVQITVVVLLLLLLLVMSLGRPSMVAILIFFVLSLCVVVYMRWG